MPCTAHEAWSTRLAAAWVQAATCLLHQGLGRCRSRLRRSSITVAEVVGLLVNLRHDELAPGPAVCQRLAVAVELPALADRGSTRCKHGRGLGEGQGEQGLLPADNKPIPNSC
jgi:hypothetical protein